ncbi:MAG: replicative DNA helicase [Patescibacteria group bacterium]
MPDITPVFEKLPPQNIEAEMALLGSLLIDKEAIIKIADIINAEDFYKDVNKIIFESMLEVWAQHTPVDILSVVNRLEERGQLDMVGGRSYLATLASSVPTSSHIVSYAQIVQKKSTLRKIIRATTEVNQMAYQEDLDTSNVLDRAEHKFFNISQKFLKQNFVSLKDTLDEAFERMDALHRGDQKLRGVPTGFTDLDSVLAGLQASELIILAARPSIGKSALALDIARRAAVYHKIPVGIFSLEMSKDQICDRIICAQAGVNLWKIRTGNIAKDGDGDFKKLGEAFSVLAETPIFIDDSPTLNMNEIRTKARRLQSEHGLGLLIIDYLQLMEGASGSENRVQEVSEISRALKAIARELNIPVLALSQLSRATEARTPSIPKLADLRESGSLEQDADVVLFIYRKAMDKSIKFCPPEERNVAEIHIGKHRHGPAGGIVKLYFEAETASYKNLDKKMLDNLEGDSSDIEESGPF